MLFLFEINFIYATFNYSYFLRSIAKYLVSPHAFICLDMRVHAAPNVYILHRLTFFFFFAPVNSPILNDHTLFVYIDFLVYCLLYI